MTKLWLALLSALLGIAPAQAQVNFTLPPPAGVVVGGVMVVTTCGMVNLTNGSLAYLAMDHTGALCTNATGGGGGGGLSVVDTTAWTQTVSPFTPTGCVFNDAATLASGFEGTLRCNTKRAAIMDVDTTGNNLYNVLTSPVPAGTNLIGKVGIDQTTPGTTNGVSVTNANANGQATMANSSPVTLASNQSVGDPCTFQAKTNIAISTNTGTTQLVAPSGSTQVYVCSISTIGATASIQNLVGGTGASCTTGTPVAAIGSLIAASGLSFAANGGMTYGGGIGSVTRTTTAGHGLCLIQSGTAIIAGNITYIQQ